MVVQRGAGVIGALAISVAMLAALALVWVGVAVPVGTHPFFYIALAFFGGGAMSLLLSGVGAAMARSREPTVWALDRQFFASVRRLVLAAWIVAIIADVLGCLIVLAVNGVRVGPTPLSVGALIITFLVGGTTVVCAGVSSFVMRRLIPRS
jgi:hypothetical protein